MPDYLTDRPDPSKPMTRAALELDARASDAMLHALITDLGGEVVLSGERFTDALMGGLRIAVEREGGGYRLRAETAEERRAEVLKGMGLEGRT